MLDDKIIEGLGPDPRTFDRSFIHPQFGKPYSEASPKDYQVTQEFFCWLSDWAQCSSHCLLNACRRHRKCTGPRMADCLDFIHPGSYPGMLIRNGFPLCIALAWQVVGPEFIKVLEQSVAADVARGHK